MSNNNPETELQTLVGSSEAKRKQISFSEDKTQALKRNKTEAPKRPSLILQT